MAIIVAGLVFVSAGTAQQLTFRASTEVIQLDVSVLDKDRKPIRGLTAADFTVIEDGKSQEVIAFAAMDVPDSLPSPGSAVGTWAKTVAPDVRTNALPPEGRLFVLLIDDALLPADPRILADARAVARSVVEHLSATDRMAVVYSENGHASQDFTADRSRLLAAVDRLRPGRAMWSFGWDTAPPPELTADDTGPPPHPRNIYSAVRDLHPKFDGDAGAREGSLRTLEDVGATLAAAPQRRKVLVYLSPGIPINPAVAAPVLAKPGQGMVDREGMLRLVSRLPELFREMQRANVTIYPIDPGGLNGMESYLTGHLQNFPALMWQEQSSLDSTGQTKPGFVPPFGELAHFGSRLNLDFLQEAAENTGGRAIVNTNDFASGIDEMFRENGSYYLLGYQATDPGSGNFHRLTVKVDRPGVEVRTRSGYYATNASDAAKAAAASPLAKAIASALPESVVSMEVTVAPFAAPGPSGASVVIALGISQPSPLERTPGTVDLETRAFTPDGDARGPSTQQAAHLIFAAGGADDVAHVQVLSHAELAPGHYQLRLAAHSSVGNRTGSVFADVEIPNFASEPVSLSGVLLETTPAPPAAPKDALAAIVPVIPAL